MTETMISSGFPKLQKDYYKVYVRSNTYNQASYIEDCLNGVAIQETDFPFVHHMIDDCSTDGEQEVIKAWIERECDLETAEYYDNDICTITLARSNSNPNYTIVAYFLKRNMYREPEEKTKLYTLWREICPYEAICEGDDYWIDAKKLRKQVDFMESHNDFSMCIHNHYDMYDSAMESPLPKYENNRTSIMEDLIRYDGGFCATASILLRCSCIRHSQIIKKTYHVGDALIVFSMAMEGKVYYMTDRMCVYRRYSIGSWSVQRKGHVSLNMALTSIRNNHKMMSDFDSYSQYQYSNIYKLRQHESARFWYAKAGYYMMALYHYNISRKYGNKMKFIPVLKLYGYAIKEFLSNIFNIKKRIINTKQLYGIDL